MSLPKSKITTTKEKKKQEKRNKNNIISHVFVSRPKNLLHYVMLHKNLLSFFFFLLLRLTLLKGNKSPRGLRILTILLWMKMNYCMFSELQSGIMYSNTKIFMKMKLLIIISVLKNSSSAAARDDDKYLLKVSCWYTSSRLNGYEFFENSNHHLTI